MAGNGAEHTAAIIGSAASRQKARTSELIWRHRYAGSVRAFAPTDRRHAPTKSFVLPVPVPLCHIGHPSCSLSRFGKTKPVEIVI